jgi:hypothetical protein
MSLKSFHIVFVVFTFLMSLFFAVWSFLIAKDVTPISSIIGWCGVVGLVLSPLYGIYFYKKAAKIFI